MRAAVPIFLALALGFVVYHASEWWPDTPQTLLLETSVPIANVEQCIDTYGPGVILGGIYGSAGGQLQRGGARRRLPSGVSYFANVGGLRITLKERHPGTTLSIHSAAPLTNEQISQFRDCMR